jgi:Kef-type K+ transport system membrane component KefB
MPHFLTRETAVNRNFLISVVVVFILTVALGFVIHGIILGPEYTKLTPNFYRTPEDSRPLFPFMFLGNLMFAIGFTWIYRQGRADRPWLGQGARFGAAVAVMSTIPTFLTYYVVQPTPAPVVVQQIIYGAISMVILGIVVAALNRDRTA